MPAWNIVVQFRGDRTWVPIYAADGVGADDAATRRFEGVRAIMLGEWRGPKNLHSGRWDAARLVRDEAVIDRFDRTSDTMMPPR